MLNPCHTKALQMTRIYSLQHFRSGANLDETDHMGRTPLWIAASKDGKEEFIKCLLEANANVDLADAKEKASPLQVGHLPVYALLFFWSFIKLGLDILVLKARIRIGFFGEKNKW